MKKHQGIPTFFFLRFLSSHPIGLHFSQYRKYTPAKKNLFNYIFPKFSNKDILLNSYDNNVYQLDSMLKQAMEILKQKGYLKNSLLVIYSDHGDALNEHGHYKNLHQEEIRVPIIFKSSRQLNLKETSFATLNDIVPTILESNHLPMAKNIDGVSLFKNFTKRLSFHSSRTGNYAVVEKKDNTFYKLMLNSKTGKVLLYDLTKDLAENDNLSNHKPKITQQLLKKLKLHFKLF